MKGLNGMKTKYIRRPVECVEKKLKVAEHQFMIVDQFDQPLIQVPDFLTAMCLKEQLNASNGKVCLELELAMVLKKIPELQKKRLEAENKEVLPNDPNIYPEEFGIDPDKAKFVQQKEIDSGKVSKDAYKKPDEVN